VANVSHVAVQGLDVVPIRVEQVGRVVTGTVVAVTGRAIRAKPSFDSRTVEGFDLLFTPRVEAQMRFVVGGCLSTTLRFVKQVPV
jgi:hypothetical protein